MLDLLLAGWRVRLMCEPAALAAAARAQYAAFVAPDTGAPDLAVSIALTPAAAAPALLDARVRSDAGSYVFDAPGGHGKITLVDRCARLTAVSATPLADVEYFLRIAVALLAYHDNGLLVHGAGLLRDGQAYLFIGQSGSGKTTVVGLSSQATALSDDMVVVRPGPQGWMAHGTPFWNSETTARGGQTANGPVAGIYKLIQDREVRLAPLSPAAAAAELLASCPVINGLPELALAALGRCRALAAAVPLQGLHFRKDDSFWAVVQRR